MYIVEFMRVNWHTPIVEITRFSLPKGVRLFAKLEFYNPGGSVKDRLGRELIEDALEKGLVTRWNNY